MKQFSDDVKRTFVDATYLGDLSIEEKEAVKKSTFSEANNVKNILFFSDKDLALAPEGMSENMHCRAADDYSFILETAVRCNSNDYDYNAKKRSVKYLYQFAVNFSNTYVGKMDVVNITIDDEIDYTISDMPSVALNKTATTLNEGKTEKLTAKVSNCSDTSVKWSSSNTEVATVSASGVVTALKAGSAVITAKKVVNGTTLSSSCKVTVNQLPAVSNLKLSSTANSVKATWSKMTAAAGYRLELVNTTTGKNVAVKNINSNSTTSYTFDNLTEGYRYSVSIKAFNTLNGNNYYGKATSGGASAIKPVGALENLQINTNLPDQINIGWNKISGVTGYKIDVLDLSDILTNFHTSYKTANNTYTIPNLKQDHCYTITVTPYRTYSTSQETFYGSFKILTTYPADKNLQNYTVTLAKNAYTYTGSQIKPQIVSVTDKNGNTIRNSTDYTVTYSNNTNIGAAKIVIKGVGKFTGSKTVTFKINAPSLAKPANLTATSKSAKTITASWSKVTNATGYMVDIKDLTTGSKLSSVYTTGTSYTASGLTSKHKYSVTVSPYIQDSTKLKYYGTTASVSNITAI